MEEIKKKLKELNARFDAHDARFDAHDARFDAIDKRFDAHDARFDAHDARFDAIDGRIDFLAQKMIEHDEDIKIIKSDLSTTKSEVHQILTSMDGLLTLVKKHDEEITMHSHGISRLHDRDDEIMGRINILHPEVA